MVRRMPAAGYGRVQGSGAGKSRARVLPWLCLLAWAHSAYADGGARKLERGASAEAPEVHEATLESLEEARELFGRGRADILVSQFLNERNEHFIFLEQLLLYVAEERYDDIFTDGDKLFEFQPALDFGARTYPALVHDGDFGGADGASCRACHFVGGPDGAGSMTQRAHFFGNGRQISSAAVRDAPHVMGLGYVSRLAREMEDELHAILWEAEQAAAFISEPEVFPLEAKGVTFGHLVALPGGNIDRSGVVGISPDLVIRPFGRKGRHAELVALSDEALQLHHGIQTSSRLATYRDRPDVIGDGPPNDPDQDDARSRGEWYDQEPGAEVTHVQPMLLAAYLALLGVPEMHVPKRPDLLVHWTRGRELLDAVGCTSCHIERHVLTDDRLVLRAVGGFDTEIELPLLSAGQDPRPLATDFGLEFSENVGTPLFLYSDLKRHDLGADIAEIDDEVLPDGSTVSGSEWLTRSLWGLAETGPYMPDGRATTLHEAILLHGGEAADSRVSYLDLSAKDQAALRIFLMSLSRHPTLLME